MVSLNLCQSDIAPTLGLKKFSSFNLQSLYFENVMNIEIEGVKQLSQNKDVHLRFWNKHVSQHTQLSAQKDVKPAYRTLVILTNTNDLNGALSADPILFPTV
jgi:hypothetical protein